MPVCLDPTARFDVRLARDCERPAGMAAVFVFRALSMREYREVGRLLERIDADDCGVAEAFDCLLAALCAGLVGWRGLRSRDMPIAEVVYDGANAAAILEDSLSPWEVRELIDAMIAAQRPDTLTKKNCESPP